MNSIAIDVSSPEVPGLAPLKVAGALVKTSRRVLTVAGLLSLLSMWAFDGGPFGLGFFLVTLATALALRMSGGLEGWQSARSHRWLLVAAVGLAGFVVVRDSELLVALDVLTVSWLVLLALRGWNGASPLVDAGLGDLAAGPLVVVANGAQRGAVALTDEVRSSKLSTVGPRLLGPALRVGLIGVPVVGLVTLLLAQGDASFGARVDALIASTGAIPTESLLRMGQVGFASALLSVGLFSWAQRRRTLSADQAEQPLRWQLGAAESFAVLGGLAVVLGLFGVVSAQCAVSESACTLPAGVTYSVYARQGFWELMAAAAVVLMALLSVPTRAKLETESLRLALRATATVLVGATLPMLVSAFARMLLYEDAYGFTRQRVTSQAICVFVSLLLVWRGVTLWTWPKRFAVGVVGSLVTVLFAFNLLNPDAFIASQNLARDGVVDLTYLRSLSADVAPMLRSVGTSRNGDADPLMSTAPATPEDSVASFNLSRFCERRSGLGLILFPFCR